MGSNSSRPKLTQVVPSGDSQEEQQVRHITSRWTSEPLQSELEEQRSSVGRRRITQLPPLRQEIPLTVSQLPAGSLLQSHSSSEGHSIIQSHPPRRAQALQPLLPPIAGILQEGVAHCKDGKRRGGASLRSSTRSPGGRCGTDGLQQGGVLVAQAELGRQAHGQRRAYRRRARELQERRLQRRVERAVFTGSVEGSQDVSATQRGNLVRRPTERDIFWDASCGKSLGFGDLEEPSPKAEEEEEEEEETPWSGSRHKFGNEGSDWGEGPRQDSPRCSYQDRSHSPKNKRTWKKEQRPSPRKQAAEKPMPWMMDWVGSSPKRATENRAGNPGWETSTQWETGYSGRRGNSNTGEEWLIGPQAREGRKRRGRLNRTRPELIPALQNHLDIDIED